MVPEHLENNLALGRCWVAKYPCSLLNLGPPVESRNDIYISMLVMIIAMELTKFEGRNLGQ